MIVSGSYTAFIKGDDWGCGVNKILLSLDHKIDQVNNLSFVVKEKKLTTDYCDTLYPIIESIIYRTVTKFYYDRNENQSSRRKSIIVFNADTI